MFRACRVKRLAGVHPGQIPGGVVKALSITGNKFSESAQGAARIQCTTPQAKTWGVSFLRFWSSAAETFALRCPLARRAFPTPSLS
jgi:hypothetical protein